MRNFHYLGCYCSPNLSIHQNSTQEPTWNFLVTLLFLVQSISPPDIVWGAPELESSQTLFFRDNLTQPNLTSLIFQIKFCGNMSKERVEN